MRSATKRWRIQFGHTTYAPSDTCVSCGLIEEAERALKELESHKF